MRRGNKVAVRDVRVSPGVFGDPVVQVGAPDIVLVERQRAEQHLARCAVAHGFGAVYHLGTFQREAERVGGRRLAVQRLHCLQLHLSRGGVRVGESERRGVIGGLYIQRTVSIVGHSHLHLIRLGGACDIRVGDAFAYYIYMFAYIAERIRDGRERDGSLLAVARRADRAG